MLMYYDIFEVEFFHQKGAFSEKIALFVAMVVAILASYSIAFAYKYFYDCF